MKKNLSILAAVLFMAAQLQAQMEPAAGNWKTWFITSGKDWRLPPPPSYKEEIAQVLSKQRKLDSAGRQQMLFWNTGSPGYRWQDMMSNLWMKDAGTHGTLAYMLLNVGIYDATIAAWDTKYAYKRPRPYRADGRIKILVPEPGSPSYPCEHSVAAGVAATVIAHFYPELADSVHRMAQELMASRIVSGAAFPGDTRAGFDLGKRIAEQEIERTKNYSPQIAWDGKIPEGPAFWKGKNPMFPQARFHKTIVLDSSSQFRPGPPPDFAKDMEELKNFKPTFRSVANAFKYGSQSEDVLSQKIFEYNLHLNPPRAARMYAIEAIGVYDGFTACWDAKFTYWGIRPDQYDTTFQPVLFHTPPFPGYPSGHAMLASVSAEICSYFFPADKAYFQQRAKDLAESRFHGGIHFRTDNEVALDMGKKVGALIVQKIKTDGADVVLPPDKRKVAH